MNDLKILMHATDGRLVKVSGPQAKAIDELAHARNGGCASVIGYRPTSNWITAPVHDIQLIAKISIKNLYQRRLKALEDISYGDIAEKVAKDEKFGDMTAASCVGIFNMRKQMLMEQIKRNLDDKPKNAHQEAHDRCYAYIGNVKVHLITEKVDGRMEPVITEGTVICDNILVPYLELNVTERQAGERKKVKSGAPVLMGKFIEGALNKRSVGLKQLSLKDDNFEEFRIDRKSFLPEDVARFGDILNS
jgi:hypothetical protein